MVRFSVCLIIFGIGFLIGGIFPSYSVQYQQRLYARIDQLSSDLKPFQEIADRYHGGSLGALIQHHLASDDATFHDEGLAIQSMLHNRDELTAANAALTASIPEQIIYFLSDADAGVAKSTWREYTPALVTTREALDFAVLSGLLLSTAFYIAWTGLRLMRSPRA